MDTQQSEYRGHRRQGEYVEAIHKIAEIIGQYPELNEECVRLNNALVGIRQPFEIAIFGRMKMGKSSILNAFLGHKLAVTGVNEATATINRIVYGSGEQLSTFRVHWKDEAPTLHSIAELDAEWTGKDASVREKAARVDFLELYSDAERLKAVSIIDTPGTDSTDVSHERIAQQFIGGQQTDALIYVSAYEVRETDLRDLQTFREGGLTTPTPYNCVCLLHKWDATYWNNGGYMEIIQRKATERALQLKGLVSDVLPVSGPLAMVARCAGSSFWNMVQSVLVSFDDETSLCRALSREEKWNRNQAQAELYACAKKDFDMPWVCFCVMLREVYRHKDGGISQFASVVWALSGYQRLEEILDKQFFTNAAIIKQRQVRARVRRVLDAIDKKLAVILEEDRKDLVRFEQVEQVVDDASLRAWAAEKGYQLRSRQKKMNESQIAWDRLRIATSDAFDADDRGMEISMWLDEDNELFNQGQKQLIKKLIYINNGDDIPQPTMQDLAALQQVLVSYRYAPDAEVRRIVADIQSIMLSVAERIFK